MAEDRVLRAVEDAETGVSTARLRTVLAIPEGDLLDALCRLCKDGRIALTDRGWVVLDAGLTESGGEPAVIL